MTSRLVLTKDTPQEILLAEPRSPTVVLTILSTLATLALRAFFPRLLIAQGLLGCFALWMLSRALKIQRLHLDIERRTYRYHQGWFFAPPRQQGTFDDIAAIAIERYESTGGLETSRLRSRLILLELEGSDDGSFVLGFPMGPKAAVEKAADYGSRLGVKWIDRTIRGENVQT